MPSFDRGIRATCLLQDKCHCVNCGAGPFYADQGIWTWQVHHVIPQQKLKSRGYSDLLTDRRNFMLLCKRCHEKHTVAFERVPFDRLHLRALVFAIELGTWAEDYLLRNYPMTASVVDTESPIL